MPQHNSLPPFGYTRRPSVLLGNEAIPQILSAGSRTFSLLSQAGGSFIRLPAPSSQLHTVPAHPLAHSHRLHIPARIERAPLFLP
ncbi:hypothetical protein LY76DRAFT_588266 [Colletotrichum caudatum]|nr:hypothetical protein LY76DRAFT_588266 [Colletotrichum caudatum]